MSGARPEQEAAKVAGKGSEALLRKNTFQFSVRGLSQMAHPTDIAPTSALRRRVVGYFKSKQAMSRGEPQAQDGQEPGEVAVREAGRESGRSRSFASLEQQGSYKKEARQHDMPPLHDRGCRVSGRIVSVPIKA
ncbi:unnamed protein product [Symbiodinium sp. KB8]|nr:unnamed protein product [Symbiodinium sp. KB8]